MKVAFGKVPITPEDYLGRTLAGYTPIAVCEGKLDDIYANAVLVEDEFMGVKRRLLLVAMDLLKPALVWSNYIKEKIQEAHHINPGQVLVHCTHTHKAPDTTGEFGKPGGVLSVIKGIMCAGNEHDRYLVWITGRIVKLVGRLIEDLSPCKMAWAREPIGRDDIVINRRHPVWRTKPAVWVLVFRALDDDRILGIVTQFACHGTTLANFTKQLSADWIGRYVAAVEEMSGGKVKTVYFNGPSGDLNPITTCGTDFEYLEDPKNRKLVYGQAGTYKSSERIGRAVARQALDMANSIPTGEFLPKLSFRAYTKTFRVPMEDFKYWSSTWLQNKAIYLAKKYLLLKVAVSHEEPNFPGLAIKHRGGEIACYSMVQWFRLKLSSEDGGTTKELGIFTAPGELFEQIGRRLRARSPTGIQNSLIIQNANDWIAYLFPREEYVGQGGYEPLASFAPVCGDYYEREMRALFDEVAAGVNLSFS
ncbi:MAG: hypothetical protein ACTSU5_13300 [Promethearchaeota archaeon]